MKFVEGRLFEAEAIIGVILSLPHAGLQTILHELNRDPLAARVLERIAHSPYGPFGRVHDSDNHEVGMSDEEMERTSVVPSIMCD